MNVTVTAFQRGAFQQNGFQIADVGPLGSGDWLSWLRMRETRKPEPVDEPAPAVTLEHVRARDYPIVADVTPAELAAAAPMTALTALTLRKPDQGVEDFHAFILEMMAAEGNA